MKKDQSSYEYKMRMERQYKEKRQLQQKRMYEKKLKRQVEFYQDKDEKLVFEKKIQKEKNIDGQTMIKVTAQIQDQNNQKMDINKLSHQKIWQKIDKIEQKSPSLARILCHQVMNKPVTENQNKQSEKIKTDFQKKVSKNPQSVEHLVLKVAQELQNSGVPVILGQKSSVHSQITIKNLVGGLMNDTIKVKQTIKDNDPACPYTFDQLQSSPSTFQKFQHWYKQKISKQTGLDPQSMVIHSVVKGGIKVQWSTNQSSQLSAAVQNKPSIQQKLKLHPFFESFRLSPQDFDPRGNIKFFESKNYVQYRGGWPYYQPIKCKRYGLNVSMKYDRGDDTWLYMNGQPGQWAVAFHGVSSPHQKKGGKKILNSIMQGMKQNQMLKEGHGQAYQHHMCLNKPNEYVGRGVYFSPHIQIALGGYTSNSDQYSLIFQCRVNPKQVKVCGNHVYWVVNDSKNIRPYGIILVKKDVKKQYISIQNQFKKAFNYNDYKDKIESYLKKI